MPSLKDVSKKLQSKFPARVEVRRVSLSDNVVNEFLGGGFPLGKQVLYYSKEGVGKTTIALSTCKDFCDAGLACIYLDFEGGITDELIEGVGLKEYSGELFFLHQGIINYEDFQEVMYYFRHKHTLSY